MDVKTKSFQFDGGDVLVEAILNKEQAHPEPDVSPIKKKQKTIALGPYHVLDFTGDNIKALLILLRIAHLQFTDIPKKLDYETLHGVAVLCNQYDCRKLVKPWLADWLREEWNESQIKMQEGWLFIAWCFGRHGIFSGLAMTYVLMANIGDCGDQMIDGGYDYLELTGKHCRGEPVEPYMLDTDDFLLPPKIVDSIFNTRKKAIDLILSAVYDVVESFEGKDRNGQIQTNCRKCGYFECPAITLGFLIRNLQQQDLWPRCKPSVIDMSIHDLVKILYRVDKLTFSGRQVFVTRGRKHTLCYPEGHLSRAITSALAKMPDPVLDVHTEYMNAANAELGLLD